MVNATMYYTDIIKGPSQRGSKIQSKVMHVTKMVHALLAGTTRAEFIRVFLDAHGLADQYAAGPLTGPLFKLWWTGVM